MSIAHGPPPSRSFATPGPAGILAVLALGCVTGGSAGVPDLEMRDRVGEVRVGQSEETAHAILRGDPVQRPGSPGNPYPSPLRQIGWTTRSGQSVRVEVYVVATRPAEGCPDVHIEDVPVAYADGLVVGKGWSFVESHWRHWGGSLAALREAQDRYRCLEPGAEPPPELLPAAGP